MASTAQIQAQINSKEVTVRGLENSLDALSPGSAEAKAVQQQINVLNGQIYLLNVDLVNSDTVTNPPDPQVLSPITPVVLSPPLVVSPVVVTSPPDPQVLSPITPVVLSPPLAVSPVVVTDPPDPAAAGPARAEIGASNVANQFVFAPNGELLPADNPYVINQNNQATAPLPQNTFPQTVGGDFVAAYDVESGKFDVVNLATGLPVKRGLTEQAAILDAQNLSVGDPGYGGLAARNFGVAYDDEGFLLPGYTLDEDNNPVYVGGDFVEPATAYSAEQSRAQALLDQARNQASVSALRKASGKAVGDGDWRVRLRLAPGANYLYKTPGINSAGIMEPLRNTDGVVFPYTPRIDMTYSAEYNPADPVHSNYRAYFYKGSRVGEIVLNADFTAQDSTEADYLLATIHFLRSCTKMFYGQDKERGTPPPIVFLSGLGEFQFNEHPCVISQFNYNLPSDVDYIRARGRQSTSAGVTQGGNGLMFRRTLSSTTTASYSLSSIWSRLTGANLPQGGMNIPPSPPNLGLNSPTYVPTKISISLTLLPMPTRSQVSQQFSLEKYANGNLLKGGFW